MGKTSLGVVVAEATQGNIELRKESAGTFVSFVWIATGVYLFATTNGATFFSWQALVFFVGGMFASAAIIGGLSYYAITGLGSYARRLPAFTLAHKLLALIGFAILLLSIVAPILVAYCTFNMLH